MVWSGGIVAGLFISRRMTSESPGWTYIPRNFGQVLQADRRNEGYLSHDCLLAAKRTMYAVTEAAFSAELIKHNIQVALLAAALGVTFGIGTALLLFENGVLLGAVAVHYTQQGFGLFMTAWLLPHGVFEIPSILIAGQAGFYLARLLLRRKEDRTFDNRCGNG